MERDKKERQGVDYRSILTAYHQARDAYRQEPSLDNERRLAGAEGLLVSAALFLPGKFSLGQTVATPGAIAAMVEADQIPVEFLLRHKFGDWGDDLPPEDVQENERALQEGSRLFSAYHTRLGEKLWVITEWDRSATTILKPDEY